jgi:hypothetical protein
MRQSLQLLAGAALFAAAPVFAADSLCPETIATKQAGNAPAPEWSVSYSASPNQLEMVTFYSGPPKDEASLVYDELASSKDSSLATWKFPKDPRGYWVKCSYRGTTLELSKPLSATVSSCRVTYSRDASLPSGLPAIRSIACR